MNTKSCQWQLIVVKTKLIYDHDVLDALHSFMVSDASYITSQWIIAHLYCDVTLPYSGSTLAKQQQVVPLSRLEFAISSLLVVLMRIFLKETTWIVPLGILSPFLDLRLIQLTGKRGRD